MTHSIKSKWKGEMAFEATQTGGSIRMDADSAVGGQNSGLLPKPLMLTSLAGCTEMDVASLFKKLRAVPEGFTVKVSAEMTDEHPKYYHKVHVEYQFYGKNLKKDKLEKCVNLSIERYCGVYRMFQAFAEITTEINYFESEPVEAKGNEELVEKV